MSEERPQQQKQKQKQNKIENKQFGCPCGKTYLSYPALYTHVRTKHNGEAPGDLKKPKTQKVRGRPKNVIIQTPIDDSEAHFDLVQQIQRILKNYSITYQQKFQTSDGSKTCQDMASKFLIELNSIDAQQLKAIHCFLNQLKQIVNKKKCDKFWQQSSPQQIIDFANQLNISHSQSKDKYPISNQVFIELVLTLFQWMYRNKWTEHKLKRRGPIQIKNQQV